ncbi:glycosyltransferase involved in cell wall biosynthesis [Rhodococcus sp. SORGH_AS303]|nr:glycosyltransferase involved in cell wall biosynthesis [Rhodococcus sp. SORGH_AS_0303]
MIRRGRGGASHDVVGARRGAATVSVVIPCFDYADYLSDAVTSVLSQVGVSVEVIVVDDASTDGSLAIARRWAATDRRVSVVAHHHNRGPVDTFNDGLRVASGEYLVRLDADDMLTPGSLHRAVALARAHPEVGLVYGHPLHVADEHLPAPRISPTGWTIWSGREWLADRCRDGLNVITSPEVLMRKSVVDRVGGQMPLAHTHDMEMWFRIAAFADVAYIRGVDQAWHRDHPRSLSSREVDPLRDLYERRDAFDVLFSGPAGQIPAAAELHRTAVRAVAEYGIAMATGCYDRREVDHDLVNGYVAFVRDAVEDPTSLDGWRTLSRRMRRGRGSATHPLYVGRRLARKVRTDASWRRWHRGGTF